MNLERHIPFLGGNMAVGSVGRKFSNNGSDFIRINTRRDHVERLAGMLHTEIGNSGFTLNFNIEVLN